VPDAAQFVQNWLAAWNGRDVEAVLAHFDEDATFASPVARKLGIGQDGLLVGKAAIRDYWTRALALVPDLHFELEDYKVGIDIIVIRYRNQKRISAAEVLLFANERVVAGFGTYPPD
jgi:hypothetical protein